MNTTILSYGQKPRRTDRLAGTLSVDQNAKLIAFNRFKDKMPANFDEQQFDDSALKEAVSAILGRIKLNEVQSLLNAQDQESLSNSVDKQYGEACADLQESGLYNFDNPPKGPRNKPAPTIEEAKETLLRKLTPAQLEVVKGMKNPVLQLKPKRKKDAYIAALNKNKPIIPRQYDAHVSLLMDDMWDDRDAADGLSNTNDDIVGWQVGFIEGTSSPAVLPGDDIKKRIGERCEWFAKEYGTKGVQGADFRSAALLQIRGLRKTPPQPVDYLFGKDSTLTMINGEPLKDSCVAGALWYNDRRYFFECFMYSQVVFFGSPSNGQFNRARFRASVMVDVD